MFTIYINILEVLAMNPSGVNASKIADMSGGLLTTQKALSALRDLLVQGFVSQDDMDKSIWQITEKAIEYCEVVVKKYSEATIMDQIAEHVRDMENVPENALKEGAGEAQIETTVVTMQEGGEVSFPLYGNLTIAEVVEVYEQNSPFKVKSASLSGDIVNLVFEPIPHDDVFDDYDPDVHGTPDEIYEDREHRGSEWY